MLCCIMFKDPATGQITITAERKDDGGVYSARCESYQIWSTAQSEDIKRHGYVEVSVFFQYFSGVLALQIIVLRCEL